MTHGAEMDLGVAENTDDLVVDFSVWPKENIIPE